MNKRFVGSRFTGTINIYIVYGQNSLHGAAVDFAHFCQIILIVTTKKLHYNNKEDFHFIFLTFKLNIVIKMHA